MFNCATCTQHNNIFTSYRQSDMAKTAFEVLDLTAAMDSWLFHKQEAKNTMRT